MRAADRADRSDSELWECVRRGERDAFAALFDRHADRVYNYCFRHTADWSAAEDLVAAVFLEAWRRRTDLELTSEDHRLLPWLLGVATNLLRRRDRSARRLAHALLRIDPRRAEPDFADDALGRVADEQRMQAILSSLRGLSRRDREVLALHLWAGLSYEETAVALGVPVGTVRSRLARARARLRGVDGTAPVRGESEVSNEAG